MRQACHHSAKPWLEVNLLLARRQAEGSERSQRLIAFQIHQRKTTGNIQGCKARNSSNATNTNPPKTASHLVIALA